MSSRFTFPRTGRELCAHPAGRHAAVPATVYVQSTKTLEEINLKGNKAHVVMTPTRANPVHQEGCVQDSGPVVGQWPEAGPVQI